LEYLISRKNDLLNVLPTDATLRIVEEINLTKNQCLIETDQRVIDCSLDVQLNNLITDLKLLGGI
jgi:flagellar assembly protein FliH